MKLLLLPILLIHRVLPASVSESLQPRLLPLELSPAPFELRL